MRYLILIIVFNHLFVFPQDERLNPNIEKVGNNLSVNLEIANRYIWRGQSWGGNYWVVQPTIEYKILDKITLGTWASHNFHNEYFYPNSVVFYKGYQEIDFYITFEINKYLTLKVWDYYWPSVEKIDGIDNGYFNYSKNGTKTVDLNIVFDFEKVWKPLSFTLSTLIAGNDYRYDINGNEKQNFTTYLESGYTFETLKNIEINPVIGLVLNNQAAYYTAGDYKKPSFVNLSLRATKEVYSHKNFIIPVYLNYIHNASSKNTENFGKNFFLVGVSFKYN